MIKRLLLALPALLALSAWDEKQSFTLDGERGWELKFDGVELNAAGYFKQDVGIERHYATLRLNCRDDRASISISNPHWKRYNDDKASKGRVFIDAESFEALMTAGFASMLVWDKPEQRKFLATLQTAYDAPKIELQAATSDPKDYFFLTLSLNDNWSGVIGSREALGRVYSACSTILKP